jgi:thiosulfate/3-mercaptopyruvate sulfurtransferase
MNGLEMTNDPLPSRWLVSTDWLADKLGKPGVTVVDGSFYLPALKRDARAEYLAGHIPGAVFFDIDAVADHSTSLPHMLPDAAQFARDVGALGIGKDDTIVVYDGAGLGGAPRVWWTFGIFGARNVFILDGGLPKWRAEGRPLEAGDNKPARRTFEASLNKSAVANMADVGRTLAERSAQVVDARPANRFRGEAAEPRPGIRSGHMPGALNVPVTELIENGRLVAPEKIAERFKAGGVDLHKPIITSCGSGVTAATLWFALDAIGKAPKALYDGSWSEWGASGEMPIEPKEKP